MTMKKIAKNIKFEDALAELEQQVQLLESGELPLEEALAAFQQGVALSKVCVTKLNTVQQEVEKIVVADNGSDDEYELETFADLED
ncbi:exodeoxyribonuclease VII small subunit [Phascolarctobacterium sp.]|jgi:exodeoxyribonuclease VII small subunit|uniref:exodeoxyribonuclease VII small subunit n=1 Tax=Phascolarctobacterium sp. TaxID=2049039 RepID=UPI00345894B0